MISLYTNIHAEKQEAEDVAKRFMGFLVDLGTDEVATLEFLKEEGGFIWKITVPDHLETYASDMLCDVIDDPDSLEIADEDE